MIWLIEDGFDGGRTAAVTVWMEPDNQYRQLTTFSMVSQSYCCAERRMGVYLFESSSILNSFKHLGVSTNWVIQSDSNIHECLQIVERWWRNENLKKNKNRKMRINNAVGSFQNVTKLNINCLPNETFAKIAGKCSTIIHTNVFYSPFLARAEIGTLENTSAYFKLHLFLLWRVPPTALMLVSSRCSRIKSI